MADTVDTNNPWNGNPPRRKRPRPTIKECLETIAEAQRKYQECTDDNKRKTYAVQRSEIELQAAKDKIARLEKELLSVRTRLAEVEKALAAARTRPVPREEAA